MPCIVTIDVFSGRVNPSWELDDAQIDQLRSLLAVERKSTIAKPLTVIGRLGYRGFKVETNREKLPALLNVGGGIVEESREAPSVIDDEKAIERFLLETGKRHLSARTAQRAEVAINGLHLLSEDPSIFAAPPYNPGKWNNDVTILERNNCYNYGCDKITNTMAQPGLGSGQVYSSHDCANVDAAAQRDGLAAVPGPSGSAPANSHYVALVMDPDEDFHWYRFDSNGRWSHKRGRTPATDRDQSGQVILNPETADRGTYTDFCKYFIVNILSVHIR